MINLSGAEGSEARAKRRIRRSYASPTQVEFQSAECLFGVRGDWAVAVG